VLLSALEETRKKFDMQIYGFVFMPEHVHLLFSEPTIKTLADALHYLRLSSSKTLRSHSGRTNARSFWQARYYDLNIRNYRQFQEKLRYIYRNPVKRGLCAEPGDWNWSSFCHYARRERLVVEMNPTGQRETGKTCSWESRLDGESSCVQNSARCIQHRARVIAN
jgi:putative transposase